MKTATPRPGRHLGLTDAERRTLPFGDHYDDDVRPPPADVVLALARGPLAEPLLPPLDAAMAELASDSVRIENGYTRTSAGAMHVALRVELPDVEPVMIDWWFGWHGEDARRYKLWHPRAHVHAAWADDGPTHAARCPRGASTAALRAAYVGRTSLVDEYLGHALGRYAIRFVPPAAVGLHDTRVEAGVDATAVAARVGLSELPVDAGHLVHHVVRVSGGSVMRSRFHLGGPYATLRAGGPLGRLATPLGRRLLAPTDEEARALLVHCAEEMAHLARFLPALYRSFAR